MKRTSFWITIITFALGGCGSPPRTSTAGSPEPAMQDVMLIQAVLAGLEPKLSPQALERRLAPHMAKPGQPRKGMAGQSEMVMAWLHVQMERYDRAETIYQAAIAEHRATGSNVSLALADALFRYARLKVITGQPGQAAQLLRESMQIHNRRDRFGDPAKLEVMNLAAQVHAQLGEFKESIALHREAIRLHPAMSASYVGAARTALLLGQTQPAMADLGRAFSFKQAAMNDAVNLVWLCRAQIDGAAEALFALQQVVKQLTAGERAEYDGQVTRYLLGELTAQQLLDEARTPYKLRQRTNRCTAYFYIAAKHESAGETQEARRHYELCRGENALLNPYHHLAASAEKR